MGPNSIRPLFRGLCLPVTTRLNRPNSLSSRLSREIASGPVRSRTDPDRNDAVEYRVERASSPTAWRPVRPPGNARACCARRSEAPPAAGSGIRRSLRGRPKAVTALRSVTAVSRSAGLARLSGRPRTARASSFPARLPVNLNSLRRVGEFPDGNASFPIACRLHASPVDFHRHLPFAAAQQHAPGLYR